MAKNSFVAEVTLKYIRTAFPSPGLLDFLRNLFFNKIWNIDQVCAVDSAALNFSKELDFTDCSMSFEEFLTISSLSLFKLI